MNTIASRFLATVLSFAAFAGVSSAVQAADEATAAAPAYQVPANAPAYIRKAIESPGRAAEQRARDANRKPAELLMLSGVKPADHVVEFASFGQYFTTLLADIVGPK